LEQYPNGIPVDMMRCDPGMKRRVDKNTPAAPFPSTDALYGSKDERLKLWK
jgi:hypothetical protein